MVVTIDDWREDLVGRTTIPPRHPTSVARPIGLGLETDSGQFQGEYARAVSGLSRRNLILIDVVAASILVVMWIVEVAQLPDQGAGRQLLAYLLAIGATAPLAVRRIAPRSAFVVMAACFAGALLLDSASTGVGCALVAYTILVEQSRRAGVVGGGCRLRVDRARPRHGSRAPR